MNQVGGRGGKEGRTCGGNPWLWGVEWSKMSQGEGVCGGHGHGDARRRRGLFWKKNGRSCNNAFTIALHKLHSHGYGGDRRFRGRK